jgi:flagellar biosynthesis protein FlhB
MNQLDSPLWAASQCASLAVRIHDLNLRSVLVIVALMCALMVFLWLARKSISEVKTTPVGTPLTYPLSASGAAAMAMVIVIVALGYLGVGFQRTVSDLKAVRTMMCGNVDSSGVRHG